MNLAVLASPAKDFYHEIWACCTHLSYIALGEIFLHEKDTFYRSVKSFLPCKNHTSASGQGGASVREAR